MTEFLTKLRSADDATKKKWIIICTAVIMVIVVYVWLAYFNTLFAGVSSEEPATATLGGQPQNTSPAASSIQYLRDRAAAMYQIFAKAIGAIGAMLGAPKEYIIRPN